MTRWERWANHGANLLVGGTGVVYAIMAYLMTPSDEWAVVNHPLQPLVQRLHILTAPMLVLGIGILLKHHILRHLRRKTSRGFRSGVIMVTQAAPMVISGYLIQTAIEPWWRSAWVAVHLVTSALWSVAYLAHALKFLVQAKNARQRATLSDSQVEVAPPATLPSGDEPAAEPLIRSRGDRWRDGARDC